MRQSDEDQNPCRWFKCNIDPFLISTVETHSSVLRFKKCFCTFLKFTTKQRSQNTSFKKPTFSPEKNKTKKAKADKSLA